MRIGICTFEKYEGRANIGSSRIRGRWLVNHWEDAEIFQQGQVYDVVIYQKSYWCEHAKVFKGIKILDLCDPDWLHWAYRTKEMIEEIDGITTSTEELANAVRKFTDKPVLCIPDRIDLDEFTSKKVHIGNAKDVVWFGYSTNYELLKPAIHFLIKNNLNLITISDKEFVVQPNQMGKIDISFYKWKEETVNNDIIKGDIVVNPKVTSGKWRFKSNNKTLTAWALGMPVATNVTELEGFLSEEARIKEADIRLIEVKEKWDVKFSINEYVEFIKLLQSKRISEIS